MKRCLLSMMILVALCNSFASAQNQDQGPDKPFANAKVIYTLAWNSDAITTVAFIGNDKVAAANKRGDILIWHLSEPEGKTPDPVRRLAGHTNEINRILVTPDGKTLVSVSSDHTVKYWDALSEQGKSGTVVLNGIVRAGVIQLNVKPPKTPEPIEASVVVQKPTRELTGHKEWVHGLAQTPDGKTLVTGDDKGVVIVWDLPAGKVLRRWQAKYWARALGISPDGKTVAMSEYFAFRHPDPNNPRRAFRLWDVETGKPKVDLSKDIKQTMSAVVYSADGKWLAVAAGGGGEPEPKGIVTLLDPTTGKKIRELTPHHELGATDLAFHPDGKHLFTAGRDQHVKIWQLKDGKHVMDLGKAKKRGEWISGISISPDGRLLAAANMAGQVLVYSLSDTKETTKGVAIASTGLAQQKEPKTGNKINNSIGMQLVYIPGGKFRMGSPQSEKGRETQELQHEVELTKGFYLGVYEVNVGQFRQFIIETKYQTDAEKDGKGSWGITSTGKFERHAKYHWMSPGFKQGDDHPVVDVSWNDAKAFCRWLSKKENRTYRLPTEAEWEYACRAGTRSAYGFGDDPRALATAGNVADATARKAFKAWSLGIKAKDGYAYTAPVGKFKSNRFGLFDMHGNVWEWCENWYDPKGYAEGKQTDSMGPASGTRKVHRGGGWSSAANRCRSASRIGRELSSYRGCYLGFRIVLSPAK